MDINLLISNPELFIEPDITIRYGWAIALYIIGGFMILFGILTFWFKGRSSWAERELYKQKGRTLGYSMWQFKGFWYFQRHWFWMYLSIILILLGVGFMLTASGIYYGFFGARTPNGGVDLP